MAKIYHFSKVTNIAYHKGKNVLSQSLWLQNLDWILICVLLYSFVQVFGIWEALITSGSYGVLLVSVTNVLVILFIRHSWDKYSVKNETGSWWLFSQFLINVSVPILEDQASGSKTIEGCADQKRDFESHYSLESQCRQWSSNLEYSWWPLALSRQLQYLRPAATISEHS